MERLSRPAQHGAALTEFIVLCLAMIPLMFGIPMIGKLIDLRQTAVQAGRYAAWETTVDGVGAPPDNVRERFFADAGAPIMSGGSSPGGNALWGGVDMAAEGVTGGPMIDTLVAIADDSAVANAPVSAYGGDGGASKGVAFHVGKVVGDAGGLLDDKVGGTWDMEFDGLLRSSISVGFEGNAWVPAATLVEPSVIMRDGWSAAGDVQAAKRTRSLVPAGFLEATVPFEQLLVGLGRIEPLKELRKLKDAFGKVDMIPLPPSESGEPRPLKAYEETR